MDHSYLPFFFFFLLKTDHSVQNQAKSEIEKEIQDEDEKKKKRNKSDDFLLVYLAKLVEMKMRVSCDACCGRERDENERGMRG